MAKFKFNQTYDDGLSDFGDLSLKVKQKGELAVWTDVETGAKIELEGKNFEISSENEDYLSAGMIKNATLTDGDDKLFVSISDLNMKAAKIMAVYDADGIEGVAFYVAKGDDTVIGSKQDDEIIGGGGDDIMTGGKGSDYFYFHAPMIMEVPRKIGPEQDVIKDFDWKGEDADQLQYNGEYDHKSIHKGLDTLITYADDSTLLLEGVKDAQFEKWVENWQTEL